MIFDTTVLIDLCREARRRISGPATELLRDHEGESAYISIITFGEFAEGFAPDQQAQCAALLNDYAVLDVTEAVAWHYATASRKLRQQGERINDNDLWIASTALAHNQPLATRNLDHFRRIPGVRLVSY